MYSDPVRLVAGRSGRGWTADATRLEYDYMSHTHLPYEAIDTRNYGPWRRSPGWLLHRQRGRHLCDRPDRRSLSRCRRRSVATLPPPPAIHVSSLPPACSVRLCATPAMTVAARGGRPVAGTVGLAAQFRRANDNGSGKSGSVLGKPPLWGRRDGRSQNRLSRRLRDLFYGL